jgi:hypothetical protein
MVERWRQISVSLSGLYSRVRSLDPPINNFGHPRLWVGAGTLRRHGLFLAFIICKQPEKRALPWFLGMCKHLYKRLRPLVRWSVGPLVRMSIQLSIWLSIRRSVHPSPYHIEYIFLSRLRTDWSEIWWRPSCQSSLSVLPLLFLNSSSSSSSSEIEFIRQRANDHFRKDELWRKWTRWNLVVFRGPTLQVDPNPQGGSTPQQTNA